MKTLSVAELKSQFSSVVTDLRNGEQVVITYGRSKKPLATIVPQSKMAKPDHSIKLGDLKEAGWTYQMKDFEMSDEELLEA
jgi:antitoxin (DNA-binding transcriptional repressor) of toxin-antitoxin stability system